MICVTGVGVLIMLGICTKSRMQELPVRDLVDDDWSLLELMSGGDRLWYVVGAYMAKTIDRVKGRRTLNSSMIEGSRAFFRAYKESLI